MIQKERNGLVYFEYELLAKYTRVRHGTFTRYGGVSQSPYSSLNVSSSTGDTTANVVENRRRIAATLFQERPLPAIIVGAHVHGDHVHVIKEQPHGKIAIPPCDALITNLDNVCLLAPHADCQVALFYDPHNEAIGCAHSGWRGSCLNIYAATINAMKREFRTDPKELIVCISPSLGPKSAEFINYAKELPEIFHPFQVTPHHFDFWEISKKQLTAAGVQEKNIEIAMEDTKENSLFFSHRREKITGRNGSCIALCV